VPKTDWKVAELMPVAVEGADMPLKRKFFFWKILRVGFFSFSHSFVSLSLPPPIPISSSIIPVVKPVRVVPQPLPGLLRGARVAARLQPHEGDVVGADDSRSVLRARVRPGVVRGGDGDVLGRPGAVGADVVVDLGGVLV